MPPGTLPEVSTWKDFRAPFPSRSRPVLSTFCILAEDTPRRCPRTLRSWGFRGSYLCPLPAFPTQSLPPTKDGAGLTQGPVSRELPTCLAGLAGLTVRGAWGGGGKGGAMGRGPQFFPLPGKQTKQTLPGSLAQPPPHTHTHPCPQGLSKRGHARLGGDGPPSWGVRGLGPWGCRCGKGAQGGVGILALVPRPVDDAAMSAPSAWLAPALF